MVDLKANFKRDMLVGDAMKFIILLGIVSLLADMTYEGARSITGPYFAILGTSATLVGFVSGFGEISWVTPCKKILEWALNLWRLIKPFLSQQESMI